MYTKIPEITSVSEFRSNLSNYMDKVKSRPVFISVHRGKDTRVILDSKMYNELIEMYEDYCDSKTLIKMKKEDDGTRISWGDIKKKHGL